MKKTDHPTCPAGIRAASTLCVAAALALAGPAHGTTLLKFGLEKMTTFSTVVVHGHVAWDYSAQPDPDGPIYTYTGIEVGRCIAGECGETITLKHRGGTIGDFTLFISGMPRFKPGQEVILFLEPDPEGEPGMYYTVGMAQGFFLVTTDAETGKKMAVQQLGAVTMAEADETGLIKAVGTVLPIILEVGELISRVEKAWNSKKKGGAK